jgi:hypothetical protein
MERVNVRASDCRLSVSARCRSALAFLRSASLARLASISALRLSDISVMWWKEIENRVGKALQYQGLYALLDATVEKRLRTSLTH